MPVFSAASSRILRKSGVPVYPAGLRCAIASTCCSVLPTPPGMTVQPSACAPDFENESAGRQVISESVVHDVARAKPGGKQRARRIPPILAVTLGLEDRAGRHQQALELARRGNGVAAERRLLSLPLLEVRLAQHRQAGQRRVRRHRLRVDAGKLRGPARRAHGARDQTRQLRELLALARFRRARLQGIVEVRHRVGQAACCGSYVEPISRSIVKPGPAARSDCGQISIRKPTSITPSWGILK